ncbi:MAG: methionine adenosyltransferase [Thermofilum sp.]|jgi:S-adenosylmethionine synthetase|nr:methionine adenosyltransferase [Thermofilum sp.]MCC6064659.1 methionine adenosyltransferase [Thermofilum sp.]
MAGGGIVVERFETPPIARRNVEFVERKGLGHPDYIADAVAEAVSRALCREYLKRYGEVLHHNVDKVLVVGGQSRPKFGGGEVLAPIYILVAGRATTEVRTEGGATETVPVGPIVLEASKEWIRSNFRFLNPEKHVIVDYKIGKGSADLVAIFKRRKEYPGANDTSLGVGFAPLSDTERLVLEVERYLNSPKVKSELPMVGEDVKVMAVRTGSKIELTVAVAFVSKFIAGREEYLSVKEEVKRRIEDLAAKITDKEVIVHVNTGDDPSALDESGYYLVVTGTSAEHGDDGATGRGNRVNGLITPMRPMSMEAAAGKNPVNHVGKLYNVVAHRAAAKIVEETGVEEAYVKLLSQIGRPINDPLVAYVGVVADESSFARAKGEIEGIVREQLDGINRLLSEFVEGKVQIF